MAQVYDASLLTQEAYAAAKATAGAIITGMSQNSVQVYLKAANHAAARVGVVGEQAMKEAVQMMAVEGVHAYTYTRKDGTLVRVPADVGIRRAVYTAGRSRLNDQTMAVAAETRHDLIEVSETRNCRPSHELINGKVFSLSGADPKYPKWDSACDACLHDYNCGHSIRIYNERIGKSFSNAMARSDQGTLEERRELVTRQRALENRIRKQKRTVDALKAAGQDTKPANARLNATRAQLRDLIAANPKVLYRDRHREAVYDSAQRMAGKNLAAKVKPAAPKHVIAEGKDISKTWKRRPDRFEFEIEDVISAQGFDGKPRVLATAEFDKAVKDSSFIAQRTYSAPSEELLSEYRSNLYEGKWYVACSGGSSYGQGMYCASDYSGVLTDGIRKEMDHYIELSSHNFGAKALVDMSKEEADRAIRKIVDAELKDAADDVKNAVAIIIKQEVVNDPQDWDDMVSAHGILDGKVDYKDVVAKARRYKEGSYSYVETMTLDSSAKVVTYLDLIKLHREYRLQEGVYQFEDIGSFAASLGYDAIKAEGAGDSGSYTVILNRTKLIIKEPEE